MVLLSLNDINKIAKYFSFNNLIKINFKKNKFIFVFFLWPKPL